MHQSSAKISLALVLALATPLSAQGARRLFRPLVDSSGVKSLNLLVDRSVARRQFITVDAAALSEASSARLIVPLFGRDVVLERTAISTAGGATSWQGRIADQPQSSVIISYRGGAMFGVIRTIRDTIFEIRSAPGGHVLEQRQSRRFPPDEPPNGSNAAPPSPPRNPAGDPAPLVCTTDPGDVIDVFVAYTPAVRTALGSAAGVEALIATAITASNRTYQNSDIAQRIRLVGTAETQYTESGNVETDRNRLAAKADGFMDDVHAKRDAAGADIVALLTETGGNFCGMSYILDPVSTAFENRGFSVIVRNCAVDNLSFPHELGHVMGARHDRFVDATDGHPYAYNHDIIRPTPAPPMAPWRTVMAYNDGCAAQHVDCTRLDYFSNPSKKWPVGGTDSMGTTNDDNRRTLNLTAKTVANFRCKKS